MSGRPRILFVVNDGAFFLSHRVALAIEARRRGYEVHVAAPDGKVTHSLKQVCDTFHPIVLSRKSLNPLKGLGTMLELIRLYRRVRPDLVHHITAKPNIYGGLAARFTRVPCVVFAITGLGYAFIGRDLRARLLTTVIGWGYRFALKQRNGAIIFQNPDDFGVFQPYTSTASNLLQVIIPGSGIDVDQIQVASEREAPPRVVLATRMLWDKGVGEFVEACESLRADGVKAEFVLIGDADDGNPATVLREQLAKWSEQGTVEWWGWRKDIIDILGDASIVVLPSYREGLPRVLLEAGACGKPLITTDVPGCREVVQHEKNGLLVPARDAQALAGAMRTLIESKVLRESMGAASRRLVEDRFSLHRVVHETFDVYERLQERQER